MTHFASIVSGAGMLLDFHCLSLEKHRKRTRLDDCTDDVAALREAYAEAKRKLQEEKPELLATSEK